MLSALRLLLFIVGPSVVLAGQHFIEAPTYREVNPNGTVVLTCLVAEKAGECRWEKDGKPVGLYTGKYEWAGVVYSTEDGAAGTGRPTVTANEQPPGGDCSLRILDASIEYDSGVWQCQVTASDFTQKDTLISDGAELVVRVPPKKLIITAVSNNEAPSRSEVEAADSIAGRAGDELELECLALGANPKAKLSWIVDGKKMEVPFRQIDRRNDTHGGWDSQLRLRLPVSRDDNGGQVRCVAEHDALGFRDPPIEAAVTLNILYSPRAEAGVEPVSLVTENRPVPVGSRVVMDCVVDSNPPPTRVWWRRLASVTGAGEGGYQVVSREMSLHVDPVTRDSAGIYECLAENEVGMSQPIAVDLQVEYKPVITRVGPQPQLTVRSGDQVKLSCEAMGSPQPTYQWLQRTTTNEVLLRGSQPDLILGIVDYAHQGEYVCKASNSKGEVQSEPIQMEVQGGPLINRNTVHSEVVVMTGDDASLTAEVCANPAPQQSWNIGPIGVVGNAILPPTAMEAKHDRTGVRNGAAGSPSASSIHDLKLESNQRHGRFVVNNIVAAGPQVGESSHCYLAELRILGAHPSDSRDYLLELRNEHGIDTHAIRLVVIDNVVSQEIFVAGIVGGILTLLLLALIIIYMVKADKCCGGNSSSNVGGKQRRAVGGGPSPVGKNGHMAKAAGNGCPGDHASDRTDIESCHSSSSSNSCGSPPVGRTIIPPDALYGVVEKKSERIKKQQLLLMAAGDPVNNKQYQQQHVFNDSREKLRPDLLATVSRSASPAAHYHNNMAVSNTYNELCFPKASNCGSMKRKKKEMLGGSSTLGRNPHYVAEDNHITSNSHGYINYLTSDFNNSTNIVNNHTYS